MGPSESRVADHLGLHTSAAMKQTSCKLLALSASIMERSQPHSRRTVVILVLCDTDILHQIIGGGVTKVTSVEL
jgi:hypothetical protein